MSHGSRGIVFSLKIVSWSIIRSEFQVKFSVLHHHLSGHFVVECWILILEHRHPTEEHDMDRMFKLPSTTFIGGKEKFLPLREILNRLENAYCNKIGVEFMFINSLEQCNWIREKFESPNAINYSNDEKRLILARVTRATGWEFQLLFLWLLNLLNNFFHQIWSFLGKEILIRETFRLGRLRNHDSSHERSYRHVHTSRCWVNHHGNATSWTFECSCQRLP